MQGSKKIQHTFNNEVQEEFGIMLGLKDPDPSIVEPLYNKLLEKTNDLIIVIKTFYANFSEIGTTSMATAMNKGFMRFKDISEKFSPNGYYYDIGVNTTMVGSEDIANQLKKNSIDDIIKNAMIGSDPKLLIHKWKELKEDAFISEIKILASNIKSLLDSEKARSQQKHDCFHGEPTDFWLVHAAGERAIIFPWSENINFTQLYSLIDKLNMPAENIAICKKAFIKILQVIYTTSLEIHNIHMTPDVNAETFSKNFIKSIMDLKKMEGFSQFPKAFGIIQNSLDILKANFNKYYYDVRSSKNIGILIENFIADVINSDYTKKSSVVAQSQLKKMVSTLTDMIKKNNKNLPGNVSEIIQRNVL